MSSGLVILSGTFTTTGQSANGIVIGTFNAALWGTPLGSAGETGTFSATVGIERSLDNGTTWVTVATDGTGTLASYTAPVSLTGFEPEDGVLYRFNCTTYTSGTINYRLSQINTFAIPFVRHV